MSLKPKKKRSVSKKRIVDEQKYNFVPVSYAPKPTGGRRATGWRTSIGQSKGRKLGSIKDTSNPNFQSGDYAIEEFYRLEESGKFVRLRYAHVGGKTRTMTRYIDESDLPSIIKQGIKERRYVEV